MTKINIKTIAFKNVGEKEKTKNYPNSGFFKAESEIGTCDLVFIDKNQEWALFICPLDIFNKIFESQEKPKTIESLNKTAELTQESIKYDSDFILEFARILLNRKQS